MGVGIGETSGRKRGWVGKGRGQTEWGGGKWEIRGGCEIFLRREGTKKMSVGEAVKLGMRGMRRNGSRG